MDLQPGARLGPYEIVSAIGRGGMGEVWKARDTRLNRDVRSGSDRGAEPSEYLHAVRRGTRLPLEELTARSFGISFLGGLLFFDAHEFVAESLSLTL